MPARALSSETYLRLKRYAKELIKLNGGQEAASLGTRVERSQLARYGQPQDDLNMPIDVVADLEAEIGEAVVTAVLAGITGHALYKLPQVDSHRDWLRHVASLSKELSDVVGKVSECLADDGCISRDEIRQTRLLRECDELIRAAVVMQTALAAVLEAGAGATGDLRRENGSFTTTANR
ncbi:hypothetical protein [Polycladidibacter hongkongensis]|uniref:hypothetical protein n=1 Tax=Polycladidibacter hongkongensis TaxID=1647556 RepID=UPI0008363F4E|nr:hypothetical protein [Pseudovibrio hongkongensis]